MFEPESVNRFQSAVEPQVGKTVRWAAHAGSVSVVLPGRRAVRGISSLALSVKRAVDICLLFDSSGSMNMGRKFPQAQQAIDHFLRHVQGIGSRVCLITVRSVATALTPLQPPFHPFYPPGSLDPDGNTALLDAVELGIHTLEDSGNPSNIWAIVAFTDGQENSSKISLPILEQRLRVNGRIRFYGVAYGGDADVGALTSLANASGGLVDTAIRQQFDLCMNVFQPTFERKGESELSPTVVEPPYSERIHFSRFISGTDSNGSRDTRIGGWTKIR